MNGGLRGTEESFKVSRGLVINSKMAKGMRERGEELCCQTKSRDIGRRGARLKRDKVDVPQVVEYKDVFETKVRGDGETSRKVSRGPFAAVDGVG